MDYPGPSNKPYSLHISRLKLVNRVLIERVRSGNLTMLQYVLIDLTDVDEHKCSG